MTASRRLLLLPDLAVEVGVGHIVRCVAIAEAAMARGIEVVVTVPSGSAPLIPRSVASAVPIAERGDEGEGRHADVVLVDSYQVTDDQLRALRDDAAVALLDDLADRDRPVDLVIDPDAPADWTLPTTRVLAGPSFIPLRPGFPTIATGRHGGTLLIAAGGTDPTGFSSQVLDRLADSWTSDPPFPRILVLQGPGAPTPLVPASLVGAVDVLRDPSDVRTVFANVDVAVTAGGMTMYELVASGVGCVAVAVVESQRPAIRRLAEAGAVLESATDGVAAAIDVLAEPKRLTDLQRRATSVIDGRGAQRIVDALIELAG